jgi:hypothetical protein
MDRRDRSCGNGYRASRGRGAVHGQGVPLEIREDGGEGARGFHDGGIARGAVFDSHFPKKVVELRFVFQRRPNGAEEVRGRGIEYSIFPFYSTLKIST